MQYLAVLFFVAVAAAFDGCEVCKNVLTPVLEKATPADREKVVSVLKGLCFGNAACEQKVDAISDDITSATPESLCTLVQLCKKTDKRGLFDVCGLCEQGVDKIKEHLSNETSEQIKNKLEYLCFGNAACIAKIDTVVDSISQASSQEVCTDLHLCKTYKSFTFTGARFCQICENVVEKFLSHINNETLAQLEATLDAQCRGNQKCLDAVAKLVAEVASLTPEEVCQQIHLCSSSNSFVADVTASDKCTACEQKIAQILSDKNLEVIETYAKKICHGNDQCTTAIDNTIAQVKANRSKYGEQLCTLAKQC